MKINLYSDVESPQFTTSTNLNLFPLNTWVHFAYRFSQSGGSATVDFFIDGQYISSSTQTLTGNIQNTDPKFGDSNTMMDDFRIYNRALSNEEIGFLAGSR